MRTPKLLRAAARLLVLALLAIPLATRTAASQERLVGAWTASTGVVYENWSFPDAIATSTASGNAVMLGGSSMLTLPVAVVAPLSSDWTLDVYTAYVRGEVRLAAPNAAGRSSYSLAGATDTKVRLVGQLMGDELLLTIGATIPTGATHLDAANLDALGVLSSPALRFRSPVLGAGAGATLGLVWSREVGGWGTAVGGSYEKRGSYAPAEALQAGAPAIDLSPGNAVHFSLAAERVLGAVRHMASVTADLYQSGELRDQAGVIPTTTVGLGPTVTGTYQLDATLGSFEAATFGVVRHRTAYKVAGVLVDGSARTELDGGLQGSRALSSTAALRLGLEGRYHTAGAALAGSSSASSTFSTAGVAAAGLTAGVRFGGARSGLAFEPFAAAHVGRMDFRTTTAKMTGLSAGATVTARF